jgi:hypothetical protein
MPRFADVFVWEGAQEVALEKIMYTECHLLKGVGDHRAGTKVDAIMFDIAGMVLFFSIGRDRSGPYCLTTAL